MGTRGREREGGGTDLLEDVVKEGVVSIVVMCHLGLGDESSR